MALSIQLALKSFVLLEKAQQYGSGLVSGNSLSWDGLMSDGRHHPQARWHNPEKSSEEAGDLEMKTVKAITLSALLAVSILAIRAQSGFLLYDLMIEIEPPQPTPNDEVLVHVSGWLPDTCYQASFSTLTRQEDSNQVTFSATVAVTKITEICLQVLVPIGKTYRLGKLAPREYEFILLGCLDQEQTCSQSSTVLAHWQFSVGTEVPPPSPCVILTADKTEVALGDLVKFELINKCGKTSTVELSIEIQHESGIFIAGTTQRVTLGSKSRREVFGFLFTIPGQYTINARLTPGGTQILRILALDGCLTPHVFDSNRNNKLDDSEIIEAIDIWIRGVNIPGCAFLSQKLSDADIIRMIDLWVRQQSLNSL
jgi:hypothetical protein